MKKPSPRPRLDVLDFVEHVQRLSSGAYCMTASEFEADFEGTSGSDDLMKKLAVSSTVDASASATSLPSPIGLTGTALHFTCSSFV
jgi:hypothetical protein